MRPRVLTTGLATLALAAAALLSGVPAASAVDATHTAVAFRSPGVNQRMAGGAVAATAPGEPVTVVAWGGGVRGHSGENAIAVIPPLGSDLTSGTSFSLLPERTSGAGQVTLTEPGRTCTYQFGTATVLDAVKVDGVYTEVAIDVVGDCATAAVRLSSTRAWTGLDVPTFVEFPNTALAKVSFREVVVTVQGTSPVTFGEASIPPTDGLDPDPADDYLVADDGCMGTVVQPGGSCTVTVAFSPWERSMRVARLRIPDNTGVGSTEVNLEGFATVDAEGSYQSLLSPVRLVDTRKSGSRKPLAAGSTTTFDVATAGVFPADASAVVLNLTAVATTSQGYFTMFPGGTTRPTASSINFPQGWTGANMVTVPISADGRIALYNYGGAAHAVIDVLGWYSSGSDTWLGTQMLPLGDAFRVFDSRQEGGPLVGAESVDIVNDWGDTKSNDQVVEYVLTVTAVGATKPGVLTVWSGEGSRPTASTVNYEPGVIAPNMTVVRAGHPVDGAGFRVSNTSSGAVDVVVDVVGIQLKDMPFGLRFHPRATPTRVLDTRKALGLSGAFGPKSTRTVNSSSVSTVDSVYLVSNVTGVQPSRRTYLSVWAAEPGATRPDASVLNVNSGAVRAASAYVPLSEAHRSRMYNDAGAMHVVMDVAGTLDWYPAAADLPMGTPQVGMRSLAPAASDATWPASPTGRTATLDDVTVERVVR